VTDEPTGGPPTTDFTTRVDWVELKTLKGLDLNARFMRHETFKQLIANVRRDGQLTSVPFAALDPEDGKYLILSGNHRVRAAIEAGVTHGFVMLTDDDLPEQRRIAIQLSHNAIEGEDDPSTLKQLYDKLEQVDWRSYAGLDDKQLGMMEKVSLPSLAEANLQFQSVSLLFLPGEANRVKEVFDQAKDMISGHDVWLARWAEYDKLLDGLEATGKSYNVTNTATSLMLMLRVFEEHLTDLQDGFLTDDGEARHNGQVPLVALLGKAEVPAGAAMTIKRALGAMVQSGDVDEHALWKAVELWAADYLAGVGAE
jgi:hypothetical protein